MYIHNSITCFFSAKLKSKRNKAFPTPYGRSEQNIRNMSMCLTGFLQISQQLVVLKLENLSFTFFDAEYIANVSIYF